MNFDPNTGLPVQQQTQQVVQQQVQQPKKDNTLKIVLIVLAIVFVVPLLLVGVIMFLTSYAVKDVMDDSKTNAFLLYAEKVIKDTQTQYIYDSNIGNAADLGVYVYDITSDINYSSTGNYRGYVVVDSTNPQQTKYYLDLNDGEYALINYEYNGSVDKSSIIKYSEDIYNRNFKSPRVACDNVKKDSSAKCLARQGYILS